MKNMNDNVFLTKITQRIKNGDFDEYLTTPFHTKELFLSSIKTRLIKKIENNRTPILSDAELKECLSETKETALNIIALYLKLNFIEKTESGFKITERYHLAMKTLRKHHE